MKDVSKYLAPFTGGIHVPLRVGPDPVTALRSRSPEGDLDVSSCVPRFDATACVRGMNQH